MEAKILQFPDTTEMQKARSRMTGDNRLFNEFRRSLAEAAADADFQPVDPAVLPEVLAEFED